MSIYLRTSIRLGPVRVGLSRSGIGISAGIPGLRVGAGPRGSYVRIGAAGVRYQATSRNRSRARTSSPIVNRAPAAGPEPGDVVMSDATGAKTEALLPAEPSELVAQLNAAARAHRMWPWALTATLALAVATPWCLLLGLPLTIWLYWRDRIRRTVVTFYEVDGPAHARYEALITAFAPALKAQCAWHVVARGDINTMHGRKVNAGAGALVSRQLLRRNHNGSPHLKSNIAIPTLQSASRTICFLPDRVLVRDRNTYVDLPYQALDTETAHQRFIESGSVPADAPQVDTTWQYVNKKGGPDRRFKNNRQLPVMLYDYLYLTTTDGLSTIWSFSATDSANTLATGIDQMRAGSAGRITSESA